MTETTSQPWPVRVAVLGVVGAIAGAILRDLLPANLAPGLTQAALAAGLVTAVLAFAYVWERNDRKGALAFAALAGLVAAGASRFGGVGGSADGELFGTSDSWRLFCGLIAIAVAAPLFQAWRDGTDAGGAPGLRHIPYPAAHDRAWTNLVLWCASFLFLGLAWATILLLAELFHLIGLDALQSLIRRDWFGWSFSGLALLGGIGLLRDQSRILSTLQRVLRFVLSALTPVLALGLGLFLVALPFTGLAPLWAATRATTPILLISVFGALVLGNAIIGDLPADESKRRPLRLAAGVLAAVILPLAAIALVSVLRRVGQHGLTPDRLWALTFVGIALAYGATYLWALLRPGQWMARVRQGNLAMGLLLCAVALVLATPLLDFGAIATRSQLARVTSGRVTPDQLDWTALRFDFGAAGAAAVKRYAGSTDPAWRAPAAAALKAQSRWDVPAPAPDAGKRRQVLAGLTVLPKGAEVPPALIDRVVLDAQCAAPGTCLLLLTTPGRAMLFTGIGGPYADRIALEKRAEGWANVVPQPEMLDDAARERRKAAIAAALARGDVRITQVPRRQLVIGGEPVGDPFP